MSEADELQRRYGVAPRDALAVRMHDLECPDTTCEPQAMGRYYRLADVALAFLVDLPGPTSSSVAERATARR